MNSFLQRFVAFLISARWPLFVLAVFVAVLAYWPSRQVRFDRSIEKMFAADDPLIPPYLRLKQKFGGNEVVMAVYHDEHLLDADGRGIARLAEISGKMKKVAGIRDVLSLAQVNALLEELEYLKSVGGVFDLFTKGEKWKGPAILNPKSPLANRFRELFAGYTHSQGGQTAAVVCMLEPSAVTSPSPGARAVSDPRTATITELKKIVSKLPGGLTPGVLAGEPVMIVEGFSLLEQDGQRLGTWTTLFLGLTILVFFRSLRWLLVPIAVVQWSVFVTRALLVVSGLQLSMVSSMLTAIVTVVGVATVMHLIVHVREMRTQGLDQRAALQKAGGLLAGPILGAILTDVAGFGALCWASVEPVRDFGTMMVVGSLIVIPAICLIVPAIALVGIGDGATPKPGWGEVHIGYWLMRSVDTLQARPKTVAAVSVAVALAASLGVMRLDVETDFTRNFGQGSEVVKAYEFVETNLGGAGVWDVILPAPPVLDREFVGRVRKLQQRLRTIEVDDAKAGQKTPALTKVISLVDALEATDDDPILGLLAPDARFLRLAQKMPTFMAALVSNELDEHGQGRLRIMLRARERQPARQKQWLIDEVTRLASEEFPASENSTGSEVTGFFVLLTNLIESILRDQWVTFAIASIGIIALVWLGFRSWQYALIAMIPNAVPIYMVMGLLGWLGLKMNMGAAMIAAVSMGMSVDSSIHYYTSFRNARREGQTVHEALTRCQQSVGLAMIFSTVALIIGFGVLITSEFVPTIYFGALMSLAMLGGMLGNLIVLPLLLSWTERDA